MSRVLAFLGWVGAMGAVAGPVHAQVTERYNLDVHGVQALGDSWGPLISGNGRFLGFSSLAHFLVPGDTDDRYDALVRDRVLGINERVALSSAGVPGNRHSYLTSLSADGRFAVFTTHSNNLVPGVDTFEHQVYVRDRLLGTTECMSMTSWGSGAHGASGRGVISDDGRFVAFHSRAINLAGVGATGGIDQVYVRDRDTGAIQCISLGSGGGQANANALFPRLSSSGRYVTFTSSATNLEPGTNGFGQAYLFDQQTGIREVLSLDTGGTPAQASSALPSAPTTDGRFVAFQSKAGTLVPGVGNGFQQIFLRDRTAGTNTLVSVAFDGSPGDADSQAPHITPDGRYVVFESLATNLVPGDTNAVRDVFVRDLLLGTTSRVNVANSGTQASQAGGYEWSSNVVSADGRSVVFESHSTDLVVADTNGQRDLFVHDLFGGIPITPYCFGDGSATACPCGNVGATGRGCDNSAAAPGAQLAAVGIADVAADTLTLHASGVPAGQPGLFLQGTLAVLGGQGLAFGDGLRCAGGAVVRLQIVSAGAAGHASTSVAISAVGNVTAGSTRYYQTWYRDPVGPCGNGQNLTNGLEIVWR